MSAPPLPKRIASVATPPAPAHEGADVLTARRLTALDAAFLGLVALSIVLDVVCAVFALGWPSEVATDAICTLYLLGMALARPAWRPLLARLFALGLAAGVLELFTDFAGERVAHSLVYPTGEPLLWGSPYVMPLGWAIVFMLLGYLAWRLAPADASALGGLPRLRVVLRMPTNESARPAPVGRSRGQADASAPRGVPPPISPVRAGIGRVPLWAAVAITALAGAALVPFYEEMAWYARWWRYTPVTLIFGHTPLYVLVFEGAIAALLPLLVGGLLARPVRYAAVLGLLEGAWMPVAALVAWLAFGR